ncbi:YsnF/AvaK domain-containing protein [Bordetella flabilis]|uniref:DUF2382 domain-containing protein n=1 Tax=Bordetella flabilis TaxID=463014 RepID=A0A193G937_9BORD|nr:YsnF/AvaK domain-containing protein [Bordetella flabilis]ANN76345.1 hypothetical protein BAU07_03755 [Bordetella flabilis]
MAQNIVGVFDSFERANDVVERLVDAGISRSDVRVHARDGNAAYEADTETGEPDRGFIENVQHFFKNLFGEEDHREEVGHYSEAVRRGGALLSVEVQDETQMATVQSLMEEGGAEDIDAKVAVWKSTGYAGFDPDAAPYTQEDIEAERQAIPVVREDLVVGKREVDTGRVRVYSRQTSTPVSESVNLRDERATIERRPVDREATAADLQGGTVEVRETSEEAVVGKTSRVVEEVLVGKEASQRTETVHETLRGTEVEVERTDDKPGGPARATGSTMDAASSPGAASAPSTATGGPGSTGTAAGTTGTGLGGGTSGTRGTAAGGAPSVAPGTGQGGGTVGTSGTSGASGNDSSSTSTSLPAGTSREPRDV